MPSKELEVDHKFPQVRWNKNEEKYNDLTEEEIKSKFILLTRSNNLLKSRHCERCVKTNKRVVFLGFTIGMKERKIGEEKTNMMKKDVLVVFSTIPINGEMS